MEGCSRGSGVRRTHIQRMRLCSAEPRGVAPLIGANAPGDIFLVPHYTQHTIKALADIQFRNVHDERAKLFPKVRAVQQTNTTTNKMSVMYETIFMDHTQTHTIPKPIYT